MDKTKINPKLKTYEPFSNSDNLYIDIKKIDEIPDGNYDFICNLKKANNLKRINKFHEKVNSIIKLNGVYISCSETMEQRSYRLNKKKYFGFKKFFFLCDFIINRVLPRLPYIKKIYFFFSGANYRVLSKAETLGRLVSCGFTILDYFHHEGLMYIVARKTSDPLFKKSSYGPLFRMKRIGKNGKEIFVYKLRTMHPFSEYLQAYVRDKHGYGENSHKLKNDFRLTKWGNIFRKYWLDELPQLINVLKGDMKIVGIRPLSKVFFDELPDDLKKERIKHKPACIPCYVSLCKKGISGFAEAEYQYLRDRRKNKIWTDFKYTYLAIKNILTGKIKSS